MTLKPEHLKLWNLCLELWFCDTIDTALYGLTAQSIDQYTYQVSVYWYLYLVFRFPNTDTDTSYFKNVLEYWYFQYFSVSVFLKNKKEIITWYMIIPKIKCNFTPLFMAVIIDHFQICNSILLGCFNWPFMIMAKVIRSRSD